VEKGGGKSLAGQQDRRGVGSFRHGINHLIISYIPSSPVQFWLDINSTMSIHFGLQCKRKKCKLPSIYL